MNNGDKPINALSVSDETDVTLGYVHELLGLTKREYLYFKILSENASCLTDGFKSKYLKYACKISLGLADIALLELEK